MPKKKVILAKEETDRLTNMAAAVGAGIALVPIPGTTAALSGIELLLIGAIARVWGIALTPAFTEGLVSWLVARLGVTLGMHVVGDLIGVVPGLGTVAKTAIAAGAIKFIGSSMNYRFSQQYGEQRHAHASAEAAKDDLDAAVRKLGANSGKLAEGAKRAFAGDGALLAATLNEIFGLATPEQPKPPPVKEPAPPPVKEPAPPPEDGIDPNLEFVLRPAGPEDFHRSWEEFRTRWQPLFKAGAWNEDEQRLLVQKASDGGHLHHVLVDGDLAGWVEYVVVDGKDPVVGHLCLDLAFAVHVLKRFCAEAQAEDRQLHVAVKANFYPLLTALTAEGFEVTSDDLDTHLTLSYFDDSEIA